MSKIAIIGAGSIIFCKTLLNDLLSTPALKGFTYTLMGPTMWKLEKQKEYADQLIEKNNLDAKIFCTTDRREALKNAKYVILMFQIGGTAAYRYDYEIPMKYGVDQCIGDSMGPGGVFRCLRSAPVIMGIGKDIKELCPDAYVLNYVNPMGAVCTVAGCATDMKMVGLCHGVQTTLDLIAGYTNVAKNEIDYLCAGINHMDWFLKLEKDGEDLYPLLRENMEKPEYYKNEKVRGEVMRQCGYFMTESTGHLSEYLPWFRKNQEVLDLYCDEPDFGGASGAYYKYSVMVAEKFAKTDVLSIESGELEPRSKEYCSYIIEALETGRPFKFSGNVRNNGFITNLPYDATVEVPIYADREGLHPFTIGDLPIQLAAMNQSNLTVQGLAAEAAIHGDPELAFWAIAMDPLTSSVLSLKDVRKMVSEMFEAEMEWLPQFAGKKLKEVPQIIIPEGTTPVPVPTDPALAINSRFGKLGE
ncbi:alpha-galactosidase [Massiliimalia massiliensis]|uniref:alpha-galactosidase n=1 Tax=Massiliimalia massiliensis TaxID=1852384 RepID=UPI000987197D|nr:alpha-galactosidase [Massiliimalia massiliensis]